MLDMRNWIARKTLNVRYFFGVRLVKLLMPMQYLWITAFKEKETTIFMKRLFGRKKLVGVEIGVETGWNARNIIKNLNIKKIFLVDPYIVYEEMGNVITGHVNNYEKAKKRLKKFSDRVIFIKKKSSDAVSAVPNGLDFVYIDGNHSYEAVKDDIKNYYPKVRKGGVIGGHDFSSSYIGIAKAVLEFAERNNLKLQGKSIDWWIVKPSDKK